VLKAGLMLADIASVGFKVENFTTANMAELEANWPGIRAALVRTVELTARFGLNGQTLRADSALMPIAYYIYHRGTPDNYVTHSHYAADREAVRQWLIRSLLKASGIWGSGLDTLLTALRKTIQAHGHEAFPVDHLHQVMVPRGKSLNFEPAEIDDLLQMQYGDKRLFPLLSLLFPFVDLRNQFHIDHVFPISRFTRARLRKSGIPEDKIDNLTRLANELPNLQLLDGPSNTEKQAAMPAEWLSHRYASEDARHHYRTLHMLGEIPQDLQEFEQFHSARKDCLREVLTKMLVDSSPTSQVD
jgi:hypothetical protein